MIAKMTRGKQEDIVEPVEDRQVVQEEEEEEEEMKTKNMEGSKSNTNMTTTSRTTTKVNNARAVSPGVVNDPKKGIGTKINPQVSVCGLDENISMRTTTILNSINNINKATSIPNRSNNNSTDNNINISGVGNVIQNEENNNLANNSVDNIIYIYDDNNISAVDNVIQNEENNILVNNCIDINNDINI
jgi:hypothetical protein